MPTFILAARDLAKAILLTIWDRLRELAANEPVAITAFVAAVIDAYILSGHSVAPEHQALAISIVTLIAGLIARSQAYGPVTVSNIRAEYEMEIEGLRGDA